MPDDVVTILIHILDTSIHCRDALRWRAADCNAMLRTIALLQPRKQLLVLTFAAPPALTALLPPPPVTQRRLS
eukprot:1738772-Pleurochrysis_carterae.AAC.4